MKILCLLGCAALFLGGCEGVNASYQSQITGKHTDYHWSTWPGADKEWDKVCQHPAEPAPVAVLEVPSDAK